MDEFYAIFRSKAPELEKVKQGFDLITRQMLFYSRGEIELLSALKDEENLLKERIKMNMTEYLRKTFAECYLMATGRKAWDDEQTA